MTLTTAQFKTRWTEFAETSDELVQETLDEAYLRTDSRLFGARTDKAAGLLAAHLLSISPQGQQARLESKDGSTNYWAERQRMNQVAAGGGRTSGQGVKFPIR